VRGGNPIDRSDVVGTRGCEVGHEEGSLGRRSRRARKGNDRRRAPRGRGCDLGQNGCCRPARTSEADPRVEDQEARDQPAPNAGTEGKPGPVTEQSAESYNATFETNVLGTLLSMKHELRVMLAQGHGSIVNVSSSYGRTGAAGASIYAASKHAVEGLTKSAALEVAGRGVRVNAVAPGPIDTGMLNRFTGTDERKAGLVATVPLHRLGAPEEIAQTIVFLASDKAAFITGASFAADGGKTAA